MKKHTLIELNDPSKVADIFGAFIETIGSVPFGNSDYQNRTAIVNAEHTPMRAYRHAALRITNRMNALIEAYYGLRRSEIEIKKLYRKKENEKDLLEIELIDLDIEQKRTLFPYTKKLINDAIREIESLFPVIESLGKITRDQFEAEEIEHFTQKLGLARDISNQTDDLYKKITDCLRVAIAQEGDV